MNTKITNLADLLLQTGEDHHAAFIEVDGDDPEWPIWYAEYLVDPLPSLLGQSLTKSELVSLLISFDRRIQEEKPDIPWNLYYAQLLIENYQLPTANYSQFPAYTGNLPSLSTEQMIEVDRAMIEDYQISLAKMMENAGRNLAHLARGRFLGHDPRGKKVVILAGTGGNGGGALAAARRLANYGAELFVVTTRTAGNFNGVPAQQLEILTRINIPIYQHDKLETTAKEFDLVIDGIIGYSLRGAPRGSAARLVRWANKQDAPILALDIPSGVDSTSGAVHDPAIMAAATMTLALPKTGLMHESLAHLVGELYLADISVPPELYAGPGLDLDVGPIFARGDIVRLG